MTRMVQNKQHKVSLSSKGGILPHQDITNRIMTELLYLQGCVKIFTSARETRISYETHITYRLLFYLTHTQKHCILIPRIGALALIISNNTVYIPTLVYEHGQWIIARAIILIKRPALSALNILQISTQKPPGKLTLSISETKYQIN